MSTRRRFPLEQTCDYCSIILFTIALGMCVLQSSQSLDPTGMSIPYSNRQLLQVTLRQDMTCSPKTDPATMRVQRPQMGRRRRTLDEQQTHPRADHPQAAPGGCRTGRRCLGPRGRKETRHKRGDLPPLEKPLWWHESRCDEAPQGAGGRERPPQEDRRRAGCGHRHPQGGEPKKLLSPSRRRVAVEHVRRHLGVSERRACRVIAQPRSSQRYESLKADRDRDLLQRTVELSRENPRYGYRRVWALPTREGWPVNKKRVHRLWRKEN